MISNVKVTAPNDRDIVVFLIGMRVNRPLKIHKWLPIFGSMPKMLKELSSVKDSGLLHYELWFSRTVILVQYWDSVEKLMDYAVSKDKEHLRWTRFSY